MNKMKLILIICTLFAISTEIFGEHTERVEIPEKYKFREPGIPSVGFTFEKGLKAIGLKRPKYPILVIKETTLYPKDSYFFSGNKYVSKLFVQFSKKSLAETARALALTGNEEEVRKKLEAYLASGKSEAKLDVFLPKFARERLGKKSKCFGPNCYNTTLCFHYPIAKCQLVVGLEQILMDPQHYRKLKPGEEMKFGDALGIHGLKGLMHSAIYLGGDLFFHKGSADHRDPYVYETFDELAKFHIEGRGKKYNMGIVVYRKLDSSPPLLDVLRK